MQNKDLNIDDSKRTLAILGNGHAAVIQGKGLAVVGTVSEADLSQLPDDEFKRVQENLHTLKIDQKGDKLTIRTKTGKPITLKSKNVKI